MSTTTQKVIHGLLKISGPMTPSQIKEASHYSRETVWRTVKELRESGQIRMVQESKSKGNARGRDGAIWEAIVDGVVLEDVVNSWARNSMGVVA